MKIATTEDIPEITNMAMDFLEVSGYADLGNEKTITINN